MHPSVALAESILQVLSLLRRDVRPGASKGTQKLPPHRSDIHGDGCFSAMSVRCAVIEIVRKQSQGQQVCFRVRKIAGDTVVTDSNSFTANEEKDLNYTRLKSLSGPNTSLCICGAVV